LGWIEIIEDTFAVMSDTFARLSWRLLEVTLAVVMGLFAWVVLSSPGPMSSFYRVITAATILWATVSVEYFIIRLEKGLSK